MVSRGYLIGAGIKVIARATESLPVAEPRLELEDEAFLLPDLHPAHDGLRIAHLSDLHVGPRTPVERLRAAIEATNALEPDMVVLTGDYVSLAREEIALMREQLGGLRAPTVAVLGNHDHFVDAQGATDALEDLGYAVLRNENTSVRLRGEPFTLVGVDDLRTRHADPDRAFRGARPGSRLVLAHVPRTAELLAARGEPMLCLSGHTHGGQIHVPGLTPALFRRLEGEPYNRGRFEVGPVQLYVNRGVGNSSVRIRVNARPEVALIRLHSAQLHVPRR